MFQKIRSLGLFFSSIKGWLAVAGVTPTVAVTVMAFIEGLRWAEVLTLTYVALAASLVAIYFGFQLYDRWLLRKKRAVDRLSNTLLEGWEILNQRIKENDFRAWEVKREFWNQKVFKDVESYFTSHDLVKIRAISGPTDQRYKYAVNDDHNTSLHFLKIRIDKFNNLIEEFKKG